MRFKGGFQGEQREAGCGTKDGKPGVGKENI